MTEPRLRGLGDAPWRFAGLALRQPADNPSADIEATASDLRRDGFLRQVGEGWKRRRILHCRQRVPLRDLKNLRAALARERTKRQHGVACAKIDADTEFGLRHRLSMPSYHGNWAAR